MGKIMNQQDAVQAAKQQNSAVLRLSKSECWHKGVIIGDPYIFHSHWINKRREICSETPDCPHCERGDIATLNASYQFWSYEGGMFRAKILELTKKAFLAVSDKLAEYGPNSIIKITRSGSGYDTKYSVSFEGKLTDDQIKALNPILLPDFEGIYDKGKGAAR